MKFKVGELAIIQNSTAPQWNDNLLVLVRQVNPTHVFQNIHLPYLITRIDGRPLGWVRKGSTSRFFKSTEAWCREDQLCKPEDAGLLEEWQVYQREPDKFEDCCLQCL